MEEIKMRRIFQIFEEDKIENIPEEISKEFERIGLSERMKPGMQIGITVGSRGIRNIPLKSRRSRMSRGSRTTRRV